jgi:carbamoyltransferase
VLEDRASEFFELRSASPFMLFATSVLQPKTIPSVTHIDGSARVQTVNEQQEPFLYDLLLAFQARTNVPVLLNTSFNIAGEPMIESPADALRCFLSTGIDILYLEDFRVTRIN